MKRYIIYYTLFTVIALFVVSCSSSPDKAKKLNELPAIYPDYTEVTIPADIAPLNFNYAGKGKIDEMYVIVRGSRSGKIEIHGDYADFDIDEWKQLTKQNIGGNLLVSVSIEQNGEWKQFKDFKIYVSKYRLDDYGLTYRRIPPGYEVGGNIGIYQRDLHSFDELAIVTEAAAPGNCMNCHTANRANPKEVTMQMRSKEHGGTLIMKDGKQCWINTKTDSTHAAGSYAYWHLAGRYIAYSTNAVHQSFFVGRHKPIEVYHNFSNIVILDTKTNQLICDSRLMTTDWLEIFPAFSSDGKTLYYSSSKACMVPRDYLKVKCSLVALPFDVATGTFGEKADTLLNGPKTNMSYVLARPSYDGRWLMYTRCSRSNFPIVQTDADLWMMDLKTRKTWPLTRLNSHRTESYHNWSSNSRWVVFSSKREDGMYTRLYLSCINDKGQATKPFLLPQKNPWEYYHKLFDAYNCPDFTKTKVDFDAHETYRQLYQGKPKGVTIR